jgi:hypothetical protein
MNIHSCNYTCQRPECVIRQRDELVETVELMRQQKAEKTWFELTDFDLRGLTHSWDRHNIDLKMFARFVESVVRRKNT